MATATDKSLISVDVQSLTEETLARKLETQAQEKFSSLKGEEKNKIKSPCDLVKDLPMYVDNLKDMPVYIPGYTAPMRLPNLAYQQLKAKLNSTSSYISSLCNNVAVKYKLPDLESCDVENLPGSNKAEKTKTVYLANHNITIFFNHSENTSYKFSEVSAVLDTTAHTITIKNLKLPFGVRTKDVYDKNKKSLLTHTGVFEIEKLILSYTTIKSSESAFLELNREYSIDKASLALPVSLNLKFNNVTVLPNFATSYIRHYGIITHDSFQANSIPILMKLNNGSYYQVNLQALKRSSNIIGSGGVFHKQHGGAKDSTLTFKPTKAYFVDETEVYSGVYDVNFSSQIATFIWTELFVPLYHEQVGVSFVNNNTWIGNGELELNIPVAFEVAQGYNATFYISKKSKVLTEELDSARISILDTKFAEFVLSIKMLYSFIGETVPDIITKLFPSLKDRSLPISYNTLTYTIGGLNLLAPAKYKDPDPLGLTYSILRQELYEVYSAVYDRFVNTLQSVWEIQVPATLKCLISKQTLINRINCSAEVKSTLASSDIASKEYDNAAIAAEIAYQLEHPEEAKKKKQQALTESEKQQQLSNARNKVNTLQYQTVMPNPATTFSSRMEQLDVTGSYDVNKMEHNEYEYEGTLCIKEKIDSPASIRIYSENKESAGPARTIESIYVDCFLLQGVQEVDEEKYSIFQSLNGDTLVQFFGRRPTTLNLSGILYDTKNQQWYNDFKYWYDNYLRGSAALKNDSRIVLVYTDQIIEGFILSMSMQKQATMNVSVTVNFTMLVVSHTQLATEWTDPEHSEHIRGDRHCGHMIDEAYAEHEKNKAKIDSLSGLNFDLLADASPDKANYYDNYLKSNTKLGAALEYSSGSSLSSIAFNSKLSDVKLNMGVSEVSSDVIAAANSNQNAGLAIGSSGISMDSLKLKLNNAEDYARSYRTSQEKSTMDQINFRLSKS